jgi:predicted nucleic acid-binding protein
MRLTIFAERLICVMLIAADTSALVALSAIRRLDLLRRLGPEVWLPPAVVKELITDGDGWKNAEEAQAEFAKREWLHPWTTEFTRLPTSSSKLGRGEIEAVSLAFEFNGTCLIDERKGRAFASAHGVPVIGALGVLCRSKRDGLVAEIKPLVMNMVLCGIIYAPDLISRVLVEMNE